MRIALLGPYGQLGTDIQHVAAARDGFEIVPVDRSVLDVAKPERIPDALRAVEFDALVNCTSYHRTDEAEGNADLAFAVNAFAVKALAQICADRQARFVHISTDYVFGAAQTVSAERSPLTESDCIAPLNVYGASKAMGESLALMAHDDTFILRVASLFGIAGASGKGGNFVETMIRVGRERGQLSVVDDVRMSPTATANVAEHLVELLMRESPPGLYHTVNTGDATWYEFAREIIDQAGIAATVDPCTSAQYPTKAQRPAYSVLSNAKLVNAIGPLADWREALNRYLRAKGHIS
ncbi:MAG: dTDP-4-dehydrorhamnose reductase [Pseudomonadota bacterium]